MLIRSMTLGCALLLCLFRTPLAEARSWSPVAGVGLALGGDPLASGTDSDDSPTPLYGGRGVEAFVGATTRLYRWRTGVRLQLQGSQGLKYMSRRVSEAGSIQFFRWPTEVLLSVRSSRRGWRAGLGPSLHWFNQLSGTGKLDSLQLDFDLAVGAVFHGGYTFGIKNQWMVGLRYESLHLEGDPISTPLSASSFGLRLTYVWR